VAKTRDTDDVAALRRKLADALSEIARLNREGDRRGRPKADDGQGDLIEPGKVENFPQLEGRELCSAIRNRSCTRWKRASMRLNPAWI
jgi:hypothetical protein